MTKANCKYCGEVETLERPRPDTPHHAEIICRECTAHIGWLAKPKNEEKRKKRPNYPKPHDLGIDYCQICLMPKKYLLPHETLETHHINGDPKDRTRQNYLVVCTACHSIINWLRTYRMRHHLEKLGVYELWIKELQDRGIEID